MCKIRNVNSHISGGPKQRNHTKDKFNNHLKDIIINKLQVAVTKNTQTGGTNEKKKKKRLILRNMQGFNTGYNY